MAAKRKVEVFSAGCATSQQDATSATNSKATTPQRRRDLAVAAACGVFVAAMVGAAFAAVPFYTWFCRTTGFGGTPLVATSAPAKALDRTITVRFDANVA